MHPDYFLIEPGIGRFVYRLARRAAGKGNAKWAFQTIYERSGSAGTFKEFCRILRKIIARKYEELAERSEALLATTLLVRGLYDHNPFSIGVSGGFSRQIARELGIRADLVIAIGASLTYHTVDGGSMYPNAEITQIDIEPVGLRHGARADFPPPT